MSHHKLEVNSGRKGDGEKSRKNWKRI